MDDTPQPIDPGTLVFLKRLVTVLTGVMVVGMIVIVTLLVLRLGQSPSLPLPDQIALPDGTRPIAVTYGPGWYAVATDTEMLIFATDGTLRQRIALQ